MKQALVTAADAHDFQPTACREQPLVIAQTAPVATLHDHERKACEQLELWTYRLGIFFILNVLDDPAWLAMMFC